MDRAQIKKVVALMTEVEHLAGNVLNEMDNHLEYNHETQDYVWTSVDGPVTGSANTGALRRRSMDLTRELARLRKAN